MKFSKKLLYALFAVILIAVVAVFVLKRGMSGTNEPFMNSTCEGTDKPYTLIAFFMDGCGHCVRFKPEWDQFVADAGSRSWGGKVCLSEVSADDPDTINKYNVRAFPTVLLFNNGVGGNPKEFEGERTAANLDAFVGRHVQ